MCGSKGLACFLFIGNIEETHRNKTLVKSHKWKYLLLSE